MATPKNIEAMDLYRSLMEEVNVRVSAINHALCGNLYLLSPGIVKQFCFLQIRMICELVALGCLVAHGDMTPSKRLHKTWAADEILETLEKLHPEFFPVATKQTKTPNGYQLDMIEGRLNKAEFIKIYVDCGKYLHKGSLKDLLKQDFKPQAEFPDIAERAQKLIDLLSHHIVTLKGGKMCFVCMLKNEITLGVQVAIGEAP